MIGIFIGIATVVALIGLGEGLRNAITSQFDMLGTDIITIRAGGIQLFGPPGTGVVKPLSKELTSKIERINGIKHVIPRLIKSAHVEFNDRLSIIITGSLPSGETRDVMEDYLGLKAEVGRLLKDGDRYKVVIGNNLRSEDSFGKELNVGNRLLIEGRQFEIVGIAKKLGNFILDNVILINEESQRELFDEPEEVSVFAIRTEKDINVEKVKEDIEKVLRKERDVKKGEEDFSVELAIDTINTLNSTLFAVQLFVYIIAAISLLVGGIGIMNTMYTSVLERTKEIGIMKSIGAQNKDVFLFFLLESGFLGFIGGLIGILIGTLIAKGFAYVGSMQLGSDLIHADISFSLIFGALAFSFIIGCIAGITPAIQASKLNPVDALRHVK
jgi:putative ABC transport system permease protein|tara:strand:- start:1160 stop:2314 length:1155 start_codon:yes stop_codon:yes gene_type:complete